MKEKEKVLDFLEKSSLSVEDKNLWRDFLEKTTSEKLEGLFSLLKEDPQSLIFFNENLKSKILALKNEDKEWFSWIVEKEKEFLEQAN